MTVDVAALKADVQDYANRHDGKIYAPVLLPGFEEFEVHHGADRFDLLAPHIPSSASTALDIGTHWGFFAHKLEEMGLDVTAVEISPGYLPFLTRIRDAAGKSFKIYDKSIFTLKDVDFDVILALNIFHHFIKTERLTKDLTDFLGRMKTKTMFFQSHHVDEGQMAGAHLNFGPEEFCEFIVENSKLKKYEHIGTYRRRPVFKIYA